MAVILPTLLLGGGWLVVPGATLFDLLVTDFLRSRFLASIVAAEGGWLVVPGATLFPLSENSSHFKNLSG
ncbi:hypothetical protein CH365_12440 [Leptospira neocaledonica]|uniref:Uncharacterized protein n=1 Tax=Leptospira neocaledonica TaxID=2023192 RepID=A0A2M9ZXP5_9LEPT|nr:hypothetical protein CH365_12440 [Leptospira neocaledonica]